ncbi:MAG: MinD/ParA family protein [Nitrospinales bacterium]
MEPGRQAKTLKRIMDGGKKTGPLKVLAITSGKGGVGKTNVVANLACAIEKRGRRVLVFDADMGLGNIDILLGLAPRLNLQHVLSGQNSIEEIIIKGPAGIDILPATSGVQELTQLNKEDRLILVEELGRIRDAYDFFIFDTGAGISSNVTYFCSAAHEIILVVTPEPTSLTDAYALMKVLHQKHGQTRFRLILNIVKSEKEALEIFRHLAAVTDRFLPGVLVDYLGYILFDENVRKAVRKQKPLFELYPHSRAVRCIDELSGKIVIESQLASDHSEQPFLWNSIFPIQ